MSGPDENQRITIVGFGLMGSQIAQVFALNGYSVTAYDVDERKLHEGLDLISGGRYGLQNAIAKGMLGPEEAERTLGRIKTTTSIDSLLSNASFVLEAAVEDIEVKRQIFKAASKLAAPDAILATNTSSLTISRISSVFPIDVRSRIIGMHFFNPPQVMRLVEVVKTPETNEEVVFRTSKVAVSLGKTPIVVFDTPGFVANRMGLSMFVEASYLLEKSIASVRDIDLAMRLGYGYPMGPFELADVVGLDARLRNLQSLLDETGMERFRPPNSLRTLVSQGYLGDPKLRKGSRGGYYEFYGLERS